MKDMYGSAMTRGEKDEMDKRTMQERAARENQSMRETMGAATTRKEMKAMKRGSRKGSR